MSSLPEPQRPPSRRTTPRSHQRPPRLEALNLPPVADLTVLTPSPIDESDLLLPEPTPNKPSHSLSEKKISDEDDKQEEEEYDAPNPATVALWRHYLFKVHKYSSYSFTAFLSLHLVTANAMPALVGIDAADNAVVLARVLYQMPVVEETLVFGSLAAHLISGAVLRLHKIRRDKRWYSRRLKMSRISFTGYLLAPLVTAHVVVARVIPLIKEGDSSMISLRYISRGFVRSRLVSWSVYTAMLGLTVYHVGYGWSRWLRIRKYTRVRIAGVTVFALGIWGLIVVSKANIAGWLGKKYDAMYEMAEGMVGLGN
ncbi:hypothetical protein POJ06DRAFT_298865 [Lipomyces tetrasporus]|uniref:Mitochondrial adapter protein MCP1 transmembrane domain-containing protein n=1 Tax=Lipomyces tetrasporus TaxID=54092 RepID=A0AAD7QW06_9ASCO|nr:uncharacterized protein POJ06DRAFT_298865 [Lipomyces tetrasporus]KAJ8102522.1 hypothetical protein POJ06DRAFT_298865 [Lipomyces tetrasporus]